MEPQSQNPTTAKPQGQGFGGKDIATILGLVCCAPVGIIMVWVWTTWNRTAKIVASAVSVGLFLVLLVTQMASQEANQAEVQRRRVACVSPNVFRVRAGQPGDQPDSWECVSPVQVAAEQEAARARAAAIAAEQERTRLAAAAHSDRGRTGAATPPATGGAVTPLAVAALPPAGEGQLPWVSQVRQNCEAYRAAGNEIQKSRIFREHEALVKAQSVREVRANLSRLETNQGGSVVFLTAEIGDDVEFATDVFSGVRRGTPVYDQASNLQEGQCVLVSGRVVGPNSVIEENKVCDLEYFFRFSAIRPCD
jgi:hypothetical protein